MWKHNRTSLLVKRHSSTTRQRLIAKAIKLAPKWMERSREEQREVLARVKRRLAETETKKDEKVIKDAERQASIIDAVISSGGIRKSKKDLDDLMTRENALEYLRAQARYRQFCKGENMNVTGHFKTLYGRLLKQMK
ncbi:hypothetical protein PoB_003121600 [Plakobranchus ocellatus]|uniref:Uncharacterized protein n=1 Tax=Plakobranchus ocellatus TaxID=259542 RepID=A0AAV4ADH3_9GAST|nr:hypothetical protein PoB_003121600 [Plakobranchus ocellatus]